jgi:hypothetical protein
LLLLQVFMLEHKKNLKEGYFVHGKIQSTFAGITGFGGGAGKV